MGLDLKTLALSKSASKESKPNYTKEEIGLDNVDNTSDMDKPVSKAQQAALDKKANIESPTLTGTPKAPTASAGANSTQIANTAFVQTSVSNHNTSTSAHEDIRDLISILTTRLNALADSDDTTLDQLSEIVDYIKSNRTLIENVTTNKVNVSDIIDNLTSTATNKPLSANQGKVLNDLTTALTTSVNNKVDKVSGKGLSTNDYTDEDKAKVAIISYSGTSANRTALFHGIADKAIQDDDGNVINKTYAKKSEISSLSVMTVENVAKVLGWRGYDSYDSSDSTSSEPILQIINVLNPPKKSLIDHTARPALIIGEGLDTSSSSAVYVKNIFGEYNRTGSKSVEYDYFTVGNGSGEASRSNALRLTKEGNLYYNKGCASGADYAEFFEWSDGNPNDEDRCGLFVTFDFDNDYDFSSYQEIPKIRPAQSGEFILGVISGNPAIVGNADEEWKGRYVRDEFDRVIRNKVVQQRIELEEVETGDYRTEIGYDEDDNEIEIQVPIMEIREIETGEYVTIKDEKIQNFNYNPNKEYVSRFDRQEWDTACMLGVISVRDDGSCITGRYCKCGTDGVATLADERGFDTYLVVRRLTDNVVKILF